ncbi:MAG TPA: S41 family peptidase [Candidatus Limnocylindrales bacterium]|nr:S41 family peptidase [Candidatus Limnocylindrales bacterium]
MRRNLLCRLARLLLPQLAATYIFVLLAAAPCAAAALGPGLSLLERQYLFADELQPKRLMKEALDAYERDIEDFQAKKLEETAWLLTSPDCELRVELPRDAGVRGLEEPLRIIGSFVEHCVRQRPKEMPPLESFLLSGVVGALDPYTAVFDEKRQAEHNIQFQGKLAGIGARIGTRNDHLVLLSVYAGSPAQKAGLQDGDQVLRIDEMSAKNILVTDAVERIRGEEGTRVVLTIQRKDEPAPRQVTVTRGIVTIPSVTTKTLPGDVLYTEITHFSQTTPDDFRTQVADAVDEGKVKGVIVDLRKNSGGSMLGSSAIGDLFLDEGVLINTAGREGRAARGLATEIRATPDTPFRDLPVLFLASPMTASGSELLAASLRNHDRALVVGEHSFGKGTIQKTYPLDPDSTLKMTVGHFLPNGEPIPGGGLAPDVEVLTFRVGQGRLSIPFPAHRSDLPFWLRRPKWADDEPRKPAYTIAFAEDFPEADAQKAERLLTHPEEAEEDGQLEDDKKVDRTLEIAAAMMRNHGSVSATAMMDGAREFLQLTSESADSEIVDFMYQRGLDWTFGPRPSGTNDFQLEVRPLTPLKAGVESEVEVRLTNKTGAPYYRLRGLLESTSAGLTGKAVAFGRIDPGATRSWTLKAKPPLGARTGRVRVTALLFDDEGEITKTQPVVLTIQEAPRPYLAFRHRIAPAAGEDGSLEVHVDVENRGDGPATRLRVRLENPLSEHFEIVEGSEMIEELAPAAMKQLDFRVRLLGTAADPPKVKLFLTEGSHGIVLEPELTLRVTPEGQEGQWHAPPRIRIDAIESTGDGTYDVIVSAADDNSLARVRARVEEDTVAYVEPNGSAVRLRVPFKPADDVKPIRIDAYDDEGLADHYYGSL